MTYLAYSVRIGSEKRGPHKTFALGIGDYVYDRPVNGQPYFVAAVANEPLKDATWLFGIISGDEDTIGLKLNTDAIASETNRAKLHSGSMLRLRRRDQEDAYIVDLVASKTAVI